jgi:predicted RNase H-like HicB family nuclease
MSHHDDIVYEQTDTGYSAYVRSLPGVGVAGESQEEVERLIREAILLMPEAPPISLDALDRGNLYGED